VRNNLFSANDFKAIVENQQAHKLSSLPRAIIKPLGDAKTQLIVNMEPDKSDICEYELIFSKNL
jgi:hypothetical protein